jgi:hypothetical protein
MSKVANRLVMRGKKKPLKAGRQKQRVELGVEDSSSLTDADWTTINTLRRAYERGGSKALSVAMKKLADDPIRYTRVMAAFFPNMIREAIRDAIAEAGITAEDLKEMILKHEKPTRLQ